MADRQAEFEPVLRSRRRKLIAGGAGLLGLMVVGIAIARVAVPAQDAPLFSDTPVAAAVAAPKQKPVAVRSLAPAEQLGEAFLVAFGSSGSATLKLPKEDGYVEEVVFEPGMLLWSGDKAILVSEGEVLNGGHPGMGKLAVHYLTPHAGSFKVQNKFIPALETGSMGSMGKWEVDPRFGPLPTINAVGGGTWQGISCGWTSLLELGPDRPVELVTFLDYYDDSGSILDDRKPTSMTGKIANIVPGRSFEVRFTGSRRFKKRFVRRGAKYDQIGKAIIDNYC